MRLVLVAVAGAAIAVLAGFAPGTTKRAATFQPLVRGLDEPLYVAATPSQPDRLYVVEQPGRIKIVEDGRVTGTFLDIRSRVLSGGEQGLLSMAFSPNYARDNRFYVDYTDKNGDTRVVEFRADGDRALPETARQLLFVDQPYANHNGGQLEFDRQGYLYVGMGDGGAGGDPQDRAQNLNDRLGKLLRTNPLRSPIRWQIVGYGLRNPWRFSFDRKTGDLWIADVGQSAWEEIDFRPRAKIARLANYGWNRYEGRSVYYNLNPLRRTGDLVFPVWQYSHAAGACSITGGYVYRGSDVPSAVGRYYFGDYCNGRVWSFRVNARGRASTPRLEPTPMHGLSSFGEDVNGELYATLLDGTVYKLR
jgi:glucose/arabinose dehydrogenase